MAAACTPPRNESEGVTGGFSFHRCRLQSYFRALVGCPWLFLDARSSSGTTQHPLPSNRISSQQFICALNQSEFLLFVRQYLTNDLCVNGEPLVRRDKKTWKLPQFVHVHTATSHFLAPRCSHTPKCQNVPLLHKKRYTEEISVQSEREEIENGFSIK